MDHGLPNASGQNWTFMTQKITMTGNVAVLVKKTTLKGSSVK